MRYYPLSWTGRAATIVGVGVALCGWQVMLVSAFAATPAPHWSMETESWPAHLRPGDKGDALVIRVVNNGAGVTDGSNIKISDSLPLGLTATAIKGELEQSRSMECHLATLTCSYNGAQVFGSSDFLMTIYVDVAAGPPAPMGSVTTVSGGGAPPISISGPLEINSGPIPFGFSNFNMEFTDEAGDPATQAGSHPFQIMTFFSFNVGSLYQGVFPSMAEGEMRDMEVALPPGLVGNANAIPKCTRVEFYTTLSCPVDSQVGTIQLDFYDGTTAQQNRPVYNIEPEGNQPAELGFRLSLFAVPIFFHVRNESDYGITSQLNAVTEGDPVQAARLVLWGVPAAPVHNSERSGLGSGACEEEGICHSGGGVSPEPFLTVPTSCQNSQLEARAAADSWQNPGRRASGGIRDLSDPRWVTASSVIPPMNACERLSFDPAILVTPEVTEANVPDGYSIHIRVPQNLEPDELSTPNLKKAVVGLPTGTVISPGVADGLVSCSSEQFALHSSGGAGCPEASKIGTVKINSALLSSALEGNIFVGAPECGPCDSLDAVRGRLVRIFIAAHGAGQVIKLEGRGSIDQATGRIMTTFDENPPLPFNEIEVQLNGGPRAALANPEGCGDAKTEAELFPWSAPASPVIRSSDFIVSGCMPRAVFSPELTAGTVNNQAGAFSSFVTTISRPDSSQPLSRIRLQMPPGLLGKISSVSLCKEPEASQGTCPAASRIGYAVVAAGSGSDPLYLPQAGRQQTSVYLTGPYGGGPFGLSIVVPAEAGPINLGKVITRAAISVDPRTAQIIVTSDTLPEALDGIPLKLRVVHIVIDRGDFIFNPTNCSQLSLTGIIAGNRGALISLSRHFQAVNCAGLAFAPVLSLETSSKTSKLVGASLLVKVKSAAGQANIGKVKVDLPKQLPSRLTTLQRACLASVFESNPAECPSASLVGTAFARTPILVNPLSGPAYIVSHGAAGFPDLEIVLQGEGVQIVLDGRTNIIRGVTSSTFDAIPDAPISNFTLSLPQGPHSILTTNLSGNGKINGTLCDRKLTAPTALMGQNGARVMQNTKIAVSGCAKQHLKSRRRNSTHR